MKRRLPHLDPRPIEGVELGYTNRFHFLQHGSLKPLTGVTHYGKLVTHNGEIVKHQPMKENKVAELRDILLSGDVRKIRNTMKFIPDYLPGDFAELEDVVSDDGWLMSANKDTVDRAAPQPSGDPDWDIPDMLPPWLLKDYLGSVWTAHKYTTTLPGWIKGVQVWIPELSDDIRYRIAFIDQSDPDNPAVQIIDNPVFVAGEWNTIAVRTAPLPTGSKFTIILDAVNSSASTFINGTWRRDTNDNNNNPQTAGWLRTPAANIIRIDKTDFDSVDRETDLLSIIAGSIVEFVSANDARRSSTYYINTTTDNGTAVVYDAILLYEGVMGEPNVGESCVMTAEVPTPQTTQYVEMENYWSANPDEWVTIEGAARLGGVDQVGVEDSAFGIRALFQASYISDDWDYVSKSALEDNNSDPAQLAVTTYTGQVMLPGNKFLDIENGLIVGVL